MVGFRCRQAATTRKLPLVPWDLEHKSRQQVAGMGARDKKFLYWVCEPFSCLPEVMWSHIATKPRTAGCTLKMKERHFGRAERILTSTAAYRRLLPALKRTKQAK